MRNVDYFRLAFSNIGRQKLRSSLTIFAVVIGATSVTIMLALVFGAKGFLKSQYEASGVLQQVIVSQQTDLDYDSARHGNGGKQDANAIKLDDALMAKVAKVPHVTAVAATAQLNVFAGITYGANKTLTVNQSSAFTPNGVIKHSVVAGRELNTTDPDGSVMITSDYLKKWGVAPADIVGKDVTLASQPGYSGPGATIVDPSTQKGTNSAGGNPNDGGKGGGGGGGQDGPVTNITAHVIGVTSSDDQDAAVYTTLAWGQKLSSQQMYQPDPVAQAAQNTQNQHPTNNCQPNKPCNSQPQQAPQPPKMILTSINTLTQNGYTQLTVRADSTKVVESVATGIRTFGVGAVTARTYVASQLQILNIVGLVLGGIGAIALLVAAIGVINTMIMAILERTREIGVMRACGATRKAVRRLFTFEASILGFMGGAVGLLLGFGLTRIANVFVNRQLASNAVAGRNIIGMPIWLILTVLGATTLIGMFAGLYPANRAARLNPVEALRYE